MDYPKLYALYLSKRDYLYTQATARELTDRGMDVLRPLAHGELAFIKGDTTDFSNTNHYKYSTSVLEALQLIYDHYAPTHQDGGKFKTKADIVLTIPHCIALLKLEMLLPWEICPEIDYLTGNAILVARRPPAPYDFEDRTLLFTCTDIMEESYASLVPYRTARKRFCKAEQEQLWDWVMHPLSY